MKRISIGSWAYTIGPYAERPIDFESVGTRLAELGFDGIELGGFPPHPNPDDLPDKSQRQDILARMQDWGLAFSGLAANLWGEQLINTEDPSKYIDAFKRNCAFCVDLEIKGIRVDAVQPPNILDQLDYRAALGRLTKAWNTCSAIAADHGLYVTWEFEPGFAFNKPSDIINVLEAVPHDNFGVLYDTSHGHMCAVVGARHQGEAEILEGGQIELIRMLRERINHIHLIDSDNTCHKDEHGEDETSLHLPFGVGVVDFPPIVAELAKVELPHDWWTIDLCFWPDAWEATASCKRFMDSLNANGLTGA